MVHQLAVRALLGVVLILGACKKEEPPPPPVTPPPAPVAPPSDPQAPDSFRVRLETTKGPVVVNVIRAWSPRGADRFHTLVSDGYFTDIAFFRVLPGFIAQFGMHGDPATNAKWSQKWITDDPVTQSNTRGTVTFATGGANTRSTQIFINLGDNAGLDSRGFSPFGAVVEGLANVDKLYGAYGESASEFQTTRIAAEGNAFLKKDFPKLDYIKTATIVAPK